MLAPKLLGTSSRSTMNESSTPSGSGPTQLAALLRDRKETLIREWEQRVLGDPAVPEARRLSEPQLRDHVPRLIDHLVDALENCAAGTQAAEAAGRWIGQGGASRAHAEHRRQEHYDLPAALRELSHLRSAVIDLCRAEGVFPGSEATLVIHAAVDEGLTTLATYLAGTTERELRENEERLRAALDDARRRAATLEAIIQSLPDAVYVGDATGIKLANQRALDMLGVDDLAALDRDVAEVVRRLDIRDAATARPVPVGDQVFIKALGGETSVREVVVRHQRSGRDVVVRSAASPIRLGDAILGAVAVNTDITERRHAEAALQRATDERDRTLDLLDAFVRTAPVGFAVIDRDFRYVRVNETLAALNGRPAGDHIGRPVIQLAPIAPDVLLGILTRVFETGEALLGREVSVVIDGAERHFLTSHHPLRDRDHAVYAVGAIVVEITAQKRTEATLREEAAFRERFMAILGHDLRNPLSTMLVGARAVLRSNGLAANAVQALVRIASSAERMGRMIEDLLDLTRVRHGEGIPVHPAPMDLGALADRVIEEFEVAHPDRTIEFGVEGDLAGAWDADRLAQALGNLIGNALEHSPPDAAVRVAVSQTGARVVVEITNGGPAIPAEAVETLFEPFKKAVASARTRPSRGLGLGLYITREIVRAHGGTIAMTSDAAHGTTFRIELPRAPPPATNAGR